MTVQSVPITAMVMLLAGGLGLVFAVFLVLALTISLIHYEETPVLDRLRVFKEKGVFVNDELRRDPFLELKELLMMVANPVATHLYGQNKKYQKQVKTLLTESGLSDSEEQIRRVLVTRAAIGLVVGAVSGLFTFAATGGLIGLSGFALLGGFMLGSLIPQFWLKSRAVKRKVEIRYNLPDTLDLTVVCVEAGLSLDATIQRVAEETERMAPDISYEFKRLNKELNAGLTRAEALSNMGQRAGVDELRSLCAMIVQADKMGTSVAESLRVYADDLRVKRRQKAEELASKASIKMTFPLVLFIFPPLFIILMGPVIIKTLQSFMH